MYKLIKEQKDIKSFVPFKGKLLYKDSENNVLYNNKIIIKKDGSTFNELNKSWVNIWGKAAISYYFNGENLIESEYFNKYYSDYQPVIGEKPIFPSPLSGYKSEFAILDIEFQPSKSLFIESNVYLVYNTNKIAILCGRKKIISKSIVDSKEIWNLNISNLNNFQIYSIDHKDIYIKTVIGVRHDQIIILLSSGNFIGIDIKSGKELWSKDKIDKNKTEYKNISFFGINFPLFNNDKGFIYILQSTMYLTFNLNTMETTYEWDIRSTKEFQKYLIRTSVLCGNKIYFTAINLENSGNCKSMGIFDIDSQSIIWMYNFSFKGNHFLVNYIQIDGDFLYVTDNKYNLYIFEKEQDNSYS